MHAGTAELLTSATMQQLPVPLVSQLQLHCAVLQALHLLRTGNTAGFFQASAGEKRRFPCEASVHIFLEACMTLACCSSLRCACLQYLSVRPSAMPAAASRQKQRPQAQKGNALLPTPERLLTLLAMAGPTAWQHEWLPPAEASALVRCKILGRADAVVLVLHGGD